MEAIRAEPFKRETIAAVASCLSPGDCLWDLGWHDGGIVLPLLVQVLMETGGVQTEAHANSDLLTLLDDEEDSMFLVQPSSFL